MITLNQDADRPHPLSLQETLQLGEAMFKSGLFPDVKNAAACVVKILAGREMGFGPFASMANVHVIEGKPSIGAHLLAAAIRRSERYDYEVVARNREVCELAFWERSLASGGETRKGVGGWVKKSQTIALRMKEAVDSGLAVAKDGKLKANWARTPDDMLFARCISKGYRTYCFAGETEVVTRDGIRRIGDLVNTEPELLIPIKGHNDGLGEVGYFQRAPIRSFGLQRLWEIRLRRCRNDLTIRTTGEHRWPLKRRFSLEANEDWRTTATLQVGDKLRDLRNCPIIRSGDPSPVGIMQGFVFGDGGYTEDRPATLPIYKQSNGKEALLYFFAACEPKPFSREDGAQGWVISGLPRSWKAVPDIRESRPFLLGWLAGWFAADGTVGDRGHPIICSAQQDNLAFARSVCAILGIRTGLVRKQSKICFGKEATLYHLSLSARDIPESFYILAHHQERAKAGAKAREESSREDFWSVVSVTETDQEEEVFCATVDGVGAFALAGDIMTGNCPDLSSGVLAYDPDELEALPTPPPIQDQPAAEPTPRLPESAPTSSTSHVQQPAQVATANTIQMARLDELCDQLRLKPGTFHAKVRSEFGHADVSQMTPQQADTMIARMEKALELARAKNQ